MLTLLATGWSRFAKGLHATQNSSKPSQCNLNHTLSKYNYMWLNNTCNVVHQLISLINPNSRRVSLASVLQPVFCEALANNWKPVQHLLLSSALSLSLFLVIAPSVIVLLCLFHSVKMSVEAARFSCIAMILTEHRLTLLWFRCLFGPSLPWTWKPPANGYPRLLW